MKRTILIFGGLALSLLLLFQISKYSLLSNDLEIEGILAIVAVVFLIVGIYLNKKSLHKEALGEGEIDLKKVEALELSKREYEVLMQISMGLSNKEIADKLFVTESTIKTHVSNVLIKLKAKRRTQAIQIAKELKIL